MSADDRRVAQTLVEREEMFEGLQEAIALSGRICGLATSGCAKFVREDNGWRCRLKLDDGRRYRATLNHKGDLPAEGAAAFLRKYAFTWQVEGEEAFAEAVRAQMGRAGQPPNEAFTGTER